MSPQEEQDHPKVVLLFFSVHITTEKRKDIYLFVWPSEAAWVTSMKALFGTFPELLLTLCAGSSKHCAVSGKILRRTNLSVAHLR
jgi:hypothetical protein